MTPVPARHWVRRLDRAAGRPPASRPELLAEADRALGEGPVRWAVDLGARMATEIIDQIPDFGGDEDVVGTLRMGTESATLLGLLMLATDDQAHARLADEGLEGDRYFARRGIRLDLVLRGVRIGHALMAHDLLEAASRLVDDEHRTAEMERVSELLFRFIDVYSSRMAEEYLAEHDRWVTSAAAERAEVVRRLIEGRPMAVADASRRLGYSLERPHLALVLWQPGGAPHSPGDLQRAAAGILETHDCTAALEVPHGTSSLWAWGSWRSRAAVPAEGSLADLSVPGPIRVAAGSVAVGPAGFRRSHVEAVRVADLVRSAPADRATGLTRYRDVELALLLSQDLPAARDFVRRELGPAAATTAAAAELRATVAAYLRCERSLARAGAQLHVARNTVAYRVRRFSELTGRDVRDRRLELEAALRLAAVLGERVLGERVLGERVLGEPGPGERVRNEPSTG